MTTDDHLSPEAQAVLEAVGQLGVQLEDTKDTIDRNTKQRIRVVVASFSVALLVLAACFVGYAQYDRVSRCNQRAETIETIKRVLAKDHDALPRALELGFPPSEDLDRVVAVIREGYDTSEAQLDDLLPEPDCGGFLP